MYNSGMVLSLAINASSIFEKFPLSAMPVSFNISRRVNPVRRSSNDRHVVLFFCKYKKYIDCRQIKTCFSFKLVNLLQGSSKPFSPKAAQQFLFALNGIALAKRPTSHRRELISELFRVPPREPNLQIILNNGHMVSTFLMA